MGSLIVVGAVVAVLGVITVARGRRRGGDRGDDVPRSGWERTRPWMMIGVGVTIAAAGLVIVVARDLQRRDLPPPSFPSLAAEPDPSLRGTIAYISEAKNPAVKERQACARVVAASGTPSRDVFCWPIDEPAFATAVWQPDGRLLVTSFDAPVGKNTPIPRWAKLVDVASGTTTDVPAADLGTRDRPPTGPATNPDGERLIREGAEGTVHIRLSGPAGWRTLLRVDDANPNWGIQSGPVWSPDFEWILMWDGTRLLVTTIDEPTTRVLVPEASGGVFNFDVPTFDITGRDLLAS